jgi:hypothetical protein
MNELLFLRKLVFSFIAVQFAPLPLKEAGVAYQ